MATAILSCRICGNRHLETLLNLGTLAHTGMFPASPRVAVPVGPLELVKCWDEGNETACGLVQLRHSLEPTELYGGHYGYRSSLNSTMVDHLAGVVAQVTELVRLRPGDLVVDIGSNDGTTLALYSRTDLCRVGVDPSAEKFASRYPAGTELIVDFFSAERVRARVGKRRARVVTSIAMFYDLERPLDFARDVRDLLADDGVWIFEQSYLPAMLEQTAYDTICHEHLEYYALKQVKWVTDQVGLKILDVRMNGANGGSFRVTTAQADAPYREDRDTVNRILAQELARGLDGPAPYRAFQARVATHRDELRTLLERSRERGDELLGYGASTKGNVVLQWCGLTAAHLPCIADVNEDKYGCVTPGSAIPIVSEADAQARNPAGFVVLPWHFRSAVLRREADFLARGGRLIFPLPAVEIVGRAAHNQAA